ncbi:MAG: RNA 2',3'-cyclic phosphodiesterase [Thermodesulfobacteriota bacterium]|nr:RNA 2',3'-cyclic phosphodiesterase [Thermodesulfobacteriota bacterium]
MSDTTRAFIAIELPEEITVFIHKIQEGLRSYGFKARWVRPENIHLTLKFLGDINKEDIKKAGDAIISAAGENASMSLGAKGIGFFPGVKRSRVIWTGIAGQKKELTDLQKTLDGKLDTVGFPKEKRPFKGHLTIARIKRKIDAMRLVDAMKEFGRFESKTFIADEVVLFKSELKPSGAVYTKLMSAALGAK